MEIKDSNVVSNSLFYVSKSFTIVGLSNEGLTDWSYKICKDVKYLAGKESSMSN